MYRSDTVGLMVCKYSQAHVDGGSVQDTGALGAKGSLGMVAGTGSTPLAALIIRNIHSSSNI